LLRCLGGVFGIAVNVEAFTLNGGYGLRHGFPVGFVSAIGVSATLALLGAVAGWWQLSGIEGAMLRLRARPEQYA
jgi:hypothetical protein